MAIMVAGNPIVTVRGEEEFCGCMFWFDSPFVRIHGEDPGANVNIFAACS